MNIHLISIIDKTIEEGMKKLLLPLGETFSFYYKEDGQLVLLADKLVEFYLLFFQHIGFLTIDFAYSKPTVVMDIHIKNTTGLAENPLHRRLRNLLEIIIPKTQQQETLLLPVHLHYGLPYEVFLVTGFSVIESGNHKIKSMLHELGIPRKSLQSPPPHLQYVKEAVEKFGRAEFTSIHKLARQYNKSYNQFQRDCKEFFGDTFYQFYNKKKMLKVVDDILFSRLSLKEIAWKNSFADYNSMYKLFRKYTRLSLMAIPRFYIK